MAGPTVKPLIDDTQEEKDSFNLWEAMKSVSTEANTTTFKKTFIHIC